MTLRKTLLMASALIGLIPALDASAHIYPTFNKKADIAAVMFADLTRATTVRLSGKNFVYKKPITYNPFYQLFITMRFRDSLSEFKRGFTKEDMLIWLDFYHDSLKSKSRTFTKSRLQHALKKMGATATDEGMNNLLSILNPLAAARSKPSIRALIKLTDLDNDHLIKRINLGESPETKKRLKYQVYLGGAINEFFLTPTK